MDTPDLLRALLDTPTAADPAPDAMLFGRFTGSWDLDITFHEDDGEVVHTTGEWHWSWILGGRCLQDVLVVPRRPAPGDPIPADASAGTSLRFLDKASATWRVVWINPRTGTMFKLSGGEEDGEIVLHGDPHDGEPTIWRFTDITDDSFMWLGYVSDDAREEWRLIQEMRATRRA